MTAAIVKGLRTGTDFGTNQMAQMNSTSPASTRFRRDYSFVSSSLAKVATLGGDVSITAPIGQSRLRLKLRDKG